jgi:hypothetical protein
MLYIARARKHLSTLGQKAEDRGRGMTPDVELFKRYVPVGFPPGQG